MPQATGPSGVQPKNWLTPGVWMTPTRAAAEPIPAVSTLRSSPPVSSVCASWVPTTEARATVPARRPRPVSLAAPQASPAPSVVVAPRSSTSWLRPAPRERSGPSLSSRSPASVAGSRTAMASAGARSVRRLTSMIWRAFRGELPVSAAASTLKATSPRLPPTRMASASRTEPHIARPSSSAAMIVSSRSSPTTRSAAAVAAGVPRRPSAIPTSASRMAGASLAPSPVIATTRPMRWYAWTMRTLWWGLHRAMTSSVGSSSSSSPSLSSSISAPVHTFWSGSSLTVAAMASAVAGWSPVSITVCTPAARSRAVAGAAEERTGSARATKPRNVRPATASSVRSSPSSSVRSATASTRRPAPASSSAAPVRRSRAAASSSFSFPASLPASLPPLPSRSRVQRSSTFSGAPLTLSSIPREVRPAVAW